MPRQETLFEHPGKELSRFFRRLGSGHVHDGILVLPVKRSAGVDNGPRVGKIALLLLPRWDGRIEGGRPRIRDDVDRSGGIRPRAHGPH